MSRASKVILLLCAFFLLTISAYGAQSTADVTASKDLKKSALEKIRKATPAAEREKEYVVGAGDILRILIYGEGDMSATDTKDGGVDAKVEGLPQGIAVRVDGQISLKHIGDVEVVGLNLTELADYLKVLYATVFDDPQVTVVLGQSNSKRFTVMGKVTNPGLYNIQYPISIVQAIAQCGGFTEWSDSKITLVREIVRDEKSLFNGNTLEFDYGKFLEGKDLQKNIEIKPEDILIVH